MFFFSPQGTIELQRAAKNKEKIYQEVLAAQTRLERRLSSPEGMSILFTEQAILNAAKFKFDDLISPETKPEDIPNLIKELEELEKGAKQLDKTFSDNFSALVEIARKYAKNPNGKEEKENFFKAAKALELNQNKGASVLQTLLEFVQKDLEDFKDDYEKDRSNLPRVTERAQARVQARLRTHIEGIIRDIRKETALAEKERDGAEDKAAKAESKRVGIQLNIDDAGWLVLESRDRKAVPSGFTREDLDILDKYQVKIEAVTSRIARNRAQIISIKIHFPRTANFDLQFTAKGRDDLTSDGNNFEIRGSKPPE